MLAVMRHAKTNLADVKDEAAEHGMGDTQESRFPREVVGAESTGFAHHRIKPGKRLPFLHRHEQAEEVHVVLSGSGTAIVEGEEIPLRAHDVLRIAPTATRTFEAGTDGLEYLVFGPRHEGDGEILPG